MKKLILVFVLLLILLPLKCSARTNITDWYIQDFNSDIQVNKDSTLLVTEKITADCGDLPDKHGIFRVLPTIVNNGSGQILTPVELVSITDFNGKRLKYTETKDLELHTITWKIGDPNKTVSGVNNYEITYKVKNVIRFGSANFDEFYWNLNGNFWDIETDNFTANIAFPSEINKSNTTIDYYTGGFGSKSKDQASYSWTGENVLQFKSSGTLHAKEGITLSASVPKNIFTPYKLTAAEEGQYLSPQDRFVRNYPVLSKTINIIGGLLPFLFLYLCFKFWKKYGKDPKDKRSVMPEFGIPDDLTPIEMGMVYSNGNLKPQYFTAGLINLAVKGVIKIEEVEKKYFFSGKDFKLTILNDKAGKLSFSEKLLIEKIFVGGSEIRLSEMQKDFYIKFPVVKKEVADDLTNSGLLDQTGGKFRIGYFFLMIGLIAAASYVVLAFRFLGIGLYSCSVILGFFAIIMPKRTVLGLDLYYKIEGFKLYMETAEKYRQQFNEKENIFEKFLPYAIMFGITKQWIKAIGKIYGDKYIASYHPIWYAGVGMANFDVDSFNSVISGISSAVGTASGASGAGGAGGGGGGGGGGGW